jgi:hypothetical protein
VCGAARRARVCVCGWVGGGGVRAYGAWGAMQQQCACPRTAGSSSSSSAPNASCGPLRCALTAMLHCVAKVPVALHSGPACSMVTAWRQQVCLSSRSSSCDNHWHTGTCAFAARATQRPSLRAHTHRRTHQHVAGLLVPLWATNNSGVRQRHQHGWRQRRLEPPGGGMPAFPATPGPGRRSSAHAHTHMHTHTHTHTHTQQHTHTAAHTHSSTHTHTRTAAHTHTHSSTHTRTAAHTHATTCLAEAHGRVHAAGVGVAAALAPVVGHLPSRVAGGGGGRTHQSRAHAALLRCCARHRPIAATDTGSGSVLQLLAPCAAGVAGAGAAACGCLWLAWQPVHAVCPPLARCQTRTPALLPCTRSPLLPRLWCRR